jgi:hypothetical protein
VRGELRADGGGSRQQAALAGKRQRAAAVQGEGGLVRGELGAEGGGSRQRAALAGKRQRAAAVQGRGAGEGGVGSGRGLLLVAGCNLVGQTGVSAHVSGLFMGSVEGAVPVED